MKKTIRKICAVALATGMVLPMAACRSKSKKNDGKDDSTSKSNVTDTADKDGDDGKDGDNGDTKGTDSSDDGSSRGRAGKELKQNPVRTLGADDAYYTTTTAELKVKVPDDRQIERTQFNELTSAGGLILANVFVNIVIPDDVQKEMNSMDLNNDKTYERYLEMQAEYCYNSLQIFDMDGNNLNAIKLGEDTQFHRAFDIGNGEILVVTHVMDWSTCVSVPYLFVINSKGEKVRDFELEGASKLNHMQVYYVENGNLLVSCEGKFYLFNNQGKKINEVEKKDLNGQMLYDNGKWYAVYMFGNTPAIQEVDVNTGELVGKEFGVNKEFFNSLHDRYDSYSFDVSGVQKLDLANGTMTPVLSWQDTDLSFTALEIDDTVVESEDSMIFFKFLVEGDIFDLAIHCSDDLYSRMAVVKVQRSTDKNPNAGKTLLKMGVCDVTDSTFMDKVNEYNSDPNGKARIEVVDYSKPSIGYSNQIKATIMHESAETMLDDLYGGTGPDILVGFSTLSDFSDDKTLLDLKTYLSSDSTIKKDDYYTNIFSAFETEDGKMYSIPLTYTLEGMAVNSFYEGAKEKWTFQDAMTMKEKLPETRMFLPKYPADDLLVTWLGASTSRFVDNANRKVNFETDAFKDLLDAVKESGDTLPTSPNNSNFYEGRYWDDYELYVEGQYAACNIIMRDLEDYCFLKEPKVGSKTIFTGYPTNEGTDMLVNGQVAMSITKCASDPDAAWDFIRFLLEEENQRSLSYNTNTLPVNKNAFHSNCKSEMELAGEVLKQYKEDPSGFGSEPYVFREEDVDALEALISSVSSCKTIDGAITDIVVDEAHHYLFGWTSFDDVLKNIQKRSTIAVQER